MHMSIEKVVKHFDRRRKKELEVLNKFELGVLVRRDNEDTIADYLSCKNYIDGLTIVEDHNSFLPLLVDHSTGAYYRDMSIYFDIDYFISLGLFGHNLQNWFNLLCSRKDLLLYNCDKKERKITGCLYAANRVWSLHNLNSSWADKQPTLGQRMKNLEIYRSLSPRKQKILTKDIKAILTS